MANNWPDGGEQPLSRRERLVMGVIGVLLVGLVVGAALFAALAVMGRRPAALEVAVVVSLALAIAMLWVRPWDGSPPKG